MYFKWSELRLAKTSAVKIISRRENYAIENNTMENNFRENDQH